MSKVRVHALAMSLDGFVAGPHQTLDDPLGAGGERLHDWAFETRTARRLHGLAGGSDGVDNDWLERGEKGIGATIIGRNMFGPIRGGWVGEPWNGWWGDNPPYHHPVFVLTHHPRDPIPMQGGTTFHFVTHGIHAALEEAKRAANGADVRVGGGAATVQQYLAADLIDEMHVAIVPILLGCGERLFDRGALNLHERYECVEQQRSDAVTHIRLARRA